MAFRFPSSGTYTFDALADGETAFNFFCPNGTDDLQDGPAGPVGRAWNWENNDTASNNIGPTSGAGGSPDGYVYTEMSSPGVFGDEFYMELDQTLDASVNNIEIQFKTNQRGDNNDAECVVETNENGAGWVERGATFGGSGDPNKVATSGTQIWASRSVDLTGLISHASTRVRIKVTAAAAGTVWHNDYGIDEFVAIGTTALTQEQEGHQFRDDDGSESGATDLGAQDSNLASLAREANIRLRVLSDNEGDAPSEGAALQYRKVGDAATEWRNIPLP